MKGALLVVGVIPARWASTRLPGKPLMTLCGRTMIERVHERARAAGTLDELVVATDDERIRACVEGFGGRVVMTSPHHETGTDRLAEAVRGLPADIVVNIQGDEPLLDPAAIDGVVGALLEAPGAQMATLATPLRESADWVRPSVVKVVVDGSGRALYFSRSPVPHDRRGPGVVPEGALHHVGLYAYRRAFLLEFAAWAPGALERIEGLEQLRALEHGAHVQVAVREHESLAVDTPEDVGRVEERIRAEALLGARRGQ